MKNIHAITIQAFAINLRVLMADNITRCFNFLSIIKQY